MSQTIKEQVHAGQQTFLSSDAKYRILACGRRWGKTRACAYEARDHFIDTPADADALVWWVAPVYNPQVLTGFRNFLKFTPDELIADVHRTDMRVTMATGEDHRIEFKSGDDPDNLRGEGVDLLVIDEAANISQYAWENALSPTLADSPYSRMVAISTPMGRNWFHKLYVRGQDGDWPDYQSWNRPSTDNPFIDHEYVENQRRVLPERAYRQEYLAEFVDDSGGVFTGVRERNVDPDHDWHEYDGHQPYAIGVDFARHQDWTVITAISREGKLCHFERIQNVSWPQIQTAVTNAYADYSPALVSVDATRDNKIVSDLEAAGVHVDPVTFTPQTKRELVENLAAALENGELVLSDEPQLINELEIFEYDVTKAGNVRYHAPEGFHDDCVDSLALANHARQKAGRSVGVESMEAKEFL